MKYKCTYTARLGAACPIMWSHKKPHPNHCHEYDCTIWRINPKLTCKYCVPLKEGEKPEKKIWCNQMNSCDTYSDGGIKECANCPVKTIVFNPAKGEDAVLDEVIEFMKSNIRLPTNSGEQLSYEADIRFSVISEIKKFRQQTMEQMRTKEREQNGQI